MPGAGHHNTLIIPRPPAGIRPAYPFPFHLVVANVQISIGAGPAVDAVIYVRDVGSSDDDVAGIGDHDSPCAGTNRHVFDIDVTAGNPHAVFSARRHDDRLIAVVSPDDDGL